MRAVVVQPLGANTAVISVRGQDAVAESVLPLASGQVLYATVAGTGEQVHLRLVPPRAVEEASRATTAAELARHLATIGVDTTDHNICLAASMLAADLAITPKHFGVVALLARDGDGDPDATGAAAAYVVRHGLEEDQATVAAIRAALFEPPCLAELLAVLDPAFSSARSLPDAGDLRVGVCRCLSDVRAGGPVEWLRVSAALCGAWPDSLADHADLSSWLRSLSAGGGALAGAAERLRTLLGGLHLINGVRAWGGIKRWVLQTPFARGGTVKTSLVELDALDGPMDQAVLTKCCDARLWVPVEESVVRARVQIRSGRAAVALRVVGSEEAAILAGASEWLRQTLRGFGVELEWVSTGAHGVPGGDARVEPPVPILGLDFEV